MDDIIMIGPIRFNSSQHTLERHGQSLRRPTPIEAKVLSTLASRPNTVWTTHELSLAVYGDANFGSFSSIISRLRWKIERDPSNPRYILTVSDGYLLRV